MQTSLNINEHFENHQSLTINKYRLTSRDLEILQFILEMKFSTVEVLHSKFFKITRFGEESISCRWAMERLGILVKYDFLSLLTNISKQRVFVITQKGYLYLKNSLSSMHLCTPLFGVDSRTYNHDLLVSKIRINMEEKALCNDWISERKLSEIDEVRKYLPTEFRPDGIYLNSENQKVAFELEIARKTKDRYKQKVGRYIQLMTDGSVQNKIFDKVHFICADQKVLSLIKDQASLFQPLFQFNLINEI